ncbi:MAG TPA: hypothetical protein VGL10_04990 [Gammaproteobacteria bacterium]
MIWMLVIILLCCTGCANFAKFTNFNSFTDLKGLTSFSNKDIYDFGKGWRHDQCRKILEDEERMQCWEVANKSYEQYMKEINDRSVY